MTIGLGQYRPQQATIRGADGYGTSRLFHGLNVTAQRRTAWGLVCGKLKITGSHTPRSELQTETGEKGGFANGNSPHPTLRK